MSSMEECILCHNLIGQTNTTPANKVLLENPHFLCTPALGAIVPGYVLITSKRHIPHSSNLTPQELASLLELVDRLKEFYSDNYKSIFFEHGSINDKERKGFSCINHFHIHLVPLTEKHVDEVFSRVNTEYSATKSYGNLSDLYLDRKLENYFLLGNDTTICLYEPDVIPSQYVRSVVADVVGREGEWNWAIYEHYENIKETVSIFEVENESI